MKRHKIDISKIGTVEYLENRIRKHLTSIQSNPDMNFRIVLDKYLNLLRLCILNEEELPNIINRAEIFVKYSILDIQRSFKNITLEIDGVSYNLNKYQNQSKQNNYNIFSLINLCLCFEFSDSMKELMILSLFEDESPYWINATKYLKKVISPESDTTNLIQYENIIENISGKGLTTFISIGEDKLIESDDVKTLHQTIHNPILTLYKLASQGDDNSFNKKLEDYTEEKRKYIGKFKKLHLFEYWIDFNAMGVCSYAKEKGIDIAYRTEYIPLLNKQ